jgi:UTP:GlnB (protein PII) uridylyltransferase
MEQQQIQIRAKDDDLKGNYSNSMQIIHTKDDFMLDFFMITPPNGVLASRVIMSPGHIKRMTKALKENIEKYEEKFGKIEAAEVPETKIGFDTGK